MLSYDAFLTRVIDDGQEEARTAYAGPKKAHKLEGALAGFEACRGASPRRLHDLLVEAERERGRRQEGDLTAFWWQVAYFRQVEWVCNCVSAALENSRLPTIVPPTAFAVRKAAEILGVGSPPGGGGTLKEPAAALFERIRDLGFRSAQATPARRAAS